MSSHVLADTTVLTGTSRTPPSGSAAPTDTTQPSSRRPENRTRTRTPGRTASASVSGIE